MEDKGDDDDNISSAEWRRRVNVWSEHDKNGNWPKTHWYNAFTDTYEVVCDDDYSWLTRSCNGLVYASLKSVLASAREEQAKMDQRAGRRIRLVALSAIIGVGKSSLMRRLSKSGHLRMEGGVTIVFVKEPEDMWSEVVQDAWTCEEREVNYLNEFYSNRELNAQPFQTIVFDTHVTVIERAIEAHPEGDLLILVERSMYDQLLFWKQQVKEKLLTTSTIFDQAYMKIWRRWMRFIPPVSLIFFLKTSNLDKVMRRLQRRETKASREDVSVFHVSVDGTEQHIDKVGGITRAYQADLLELHEQFYATPLAFPPEGPALGIPCVHLDADAPYHEEDVSLTQLAQQMMIHLEKLFA